MIKFLRHSRLAAVILTVLRVFIGYQWMSAGIGKLMAEESFSASGLINGALNSPTAYPWFHSFLSLTTDSGANTAFFDFVVPWGQVIVGLALILGAYTLFVASAGLMMNIAFILSGVISENPTFILIQVLILVAGYNAGRYGLDYWITPIVRNIFPFLHNDTLLENG
ncbi:DoxX family protein [Lactococcus protaetiae]|uniref:DoxX family protein n=1 Tax=Lactococcus protaetiae TaxID=2592653 RepID=A0A514ZAU4_9LACT|nr:DoxX family protein [Lactococcus protaetiae]MCL2112901.1 DoxX family protein [Streptococcaceae bacterium]QDK71699.1 DoxX family protein [Lactococcus protaetiae]